MRAIPLFDNILIKPIQKKKETKAGIVLPEDKDVNQTIEGEVIAIGLGKVLPVVIKTLTGEQLAKQFVVVSVGQHVVFKQFVGTPIKINGEKLLLVNQNDLQAIIEYE